MHEQTKRLVEILENQKFDTDAQLYNSVPYTTGKLIDSMDAIEECCSVCEVESKSWHDFWVVQRAVVRALWVILNWIIRKAIKG